MSEFEANIRKILIFKLEEMAEIKFEDCMDSRDYSNICNAMNDIARTLLNK